MLIVDDHRNTRESLALSVRVYGCHADAVGSAEEALAYLESATYDWVVSDVRMPGTTGVELAEIVHRRYPKVKTILMTAYALTPEESAVTAASGTVLLIKPVTAEHLVEHCAAFV
jgi:CheY-like chemotaxis protein